MNQEQEQQDNVLIPEHTPTPANLVAATDLAIKAYKAKSTEPYAAACVVLALECAHLRKAMAQSVAVIALVPPSEETSTSANESRATH